MGIERKTAFAIVVLAGSLPLLGSPSAARAFSMRVGEQGQPLRWSGPSIVLTVDRSFDALGPAHAVRAALDSAAAEWAHAEPSPPIELGEGDPGELGFDPRHPERTPPGVFYVVDDWPFDPAAVAVTIVTYRESTGEILDADVAVRGDGAPLALALEPAEAGAYDLANAMTHELGHVLGLDESADHPEATMYPWAYPGETAKRSLAQDDIDGASSLYRHALPDAPSCGVASGARRGAPGLPLLAWVALAVALVTAIALAARRGPSAPWSRRRQRGLLAASVVLSLGGSVPSPAERATAALPSHATNATSLSGTTERRGGLLFTTLETTQGGVRQRRVVAGGREGEIAQWVSAPLRRVGPEHPPSPLDRDTGSSGDSSLVVPTSL